MEDVSNGWQSRGSGLGERTSERFSSASPTVRLRSSYTPPLINAITSTASKTLSTVPA